MKDFFFSLLFSLSHSLTVLIHSHFLVRSLAGWNRWILKLEKRDSSSSFTQHLLLICFSFEKTLDLEASLFPLNYFALPYSLYPGLKLRNGSRQICLTLLWIFSYDFIQCQHSHLGSHLNSGYNPCFSNLCCTLLMPRLYWAKFGLFKFEHLSSPSAPLLQCLVSTQLVFSIHLLSEPWAGESWLWKFPFGPDQSSSGAAWSLLVPPQTASSSSAGRRGLLGKTPPETLSFLCSTSSVPCPPSRSPFHHLLIIFLNSQSAQFSLIPPLLCSHELAVCAALNVVAQLRFLSC